MWLRPSFSPLHAPFAQRQPRVMRRLFSRGLVGHPPFRPLIANCVQPCPFFCRHLQIKILTTSAISIRLRVPKIVVAFQQNMLHSYSFPAGPLKYNLNTLMVNQKFTFKCHLTFPGDEPPARVRESGASARWVSVVPPSPPTHLSSAPRSSNDAGFGGWMFLTILAPASAIVGRIYNTDTLPQPPQPSTLCMTRIQQLSITSIRTIKPGYIILLTPLQVPRASGHHLLHLRNTVDDNNT